MLESLFTPVCTDPVEWVESRLSFPLSVSPSAPGPISLARQPWMREILAAFLDTTVEHLHMVMGTQTGKTTTCMLGAALLAEFDPLPLIWGMPTDDLAKKHATTRMVPFFEDNPELSRHLPGGKAEHPLRLDMDVMTLYLTGVMTPAKVASIPAAYIICDEEAKFEHAKKGEAHPVLLLEERTKSFPRKLIVHASTPNIEENIFWRGYMHSDRRKYYMPCPHCGAWITFEHGADRIVWPEDATTEEAVRNTAVYICQECGGAITDTDKETMLAAGEWRPTNPHAPANRRGYHINSLYSHNVTIGEFAAAAWRCRHDPFPRQAWQNFVNSWCALPWREYSVRVQDSQITALAGEYPRGTVPVKHYWYIIVCYDPGEKQTHWVATCVGAGGEMWVIDYGTILAIETDPAAGKQGIAHHFSTLQWGSIRPDFGYVDSGDWTMTVYAECEKAPALTPTKGADTRHGTYSVTPCKNSDTLNLVVYSDFQAKRELYGEIISQGRLSPLHLPGDITPDFIAGLTGQTLERRPNGAPQWKKLPNDHFGDCLKLARISWWVNRPYLEAPDPAEQPTNQTTENDQ